MFVGQNSIGAVHLDAGRKVTSGSTYLGSNACSHGAVSIGGAGSIWESFQDLEDGFGGCASLLIAGSGHVQSLRGILGRSGGSVGIATITGTDATWEILRISTWVTCGNGVLSVGSGGRVQNATGYIGFNPGVSNTVSIAGSASTWANLADLHVGFGGSGILEATAGGVVTGRNGFSRNERQRHRHRQRIAGTGSIWENSQDLFVGHYGSGTLNISNGVLIDNKYGYTGFTPGCNGIVIFSGAGSTWTFLHEHYVGSYGNGTQQLLERRARQ